MTEGNNEVDISPRRGEGPDADKVPSKDSGVEAHDMAPTPDGIILLIGTSGAGKSHFLNRLIGQDVVGVGHTINSETQDCQAVIAQVNDEASIAIIDTPGFLDSHRTDAEVFETIVTYLTAQYMVGIKLFGIIYFHPITHSRLSHCDRLYISMLQAMCGKQAMRNVILATTKWDKFKNQVEGYDTEQQIRGLWKGLNVVNFDGSQGMARYIIMKMMENEKFVLDIQIEICVDGLNYDQTAAGKILIPQIESQWQTERLSIESLDREIAESAAGDIKALSNDREKAAKKQQELNDGRDRMRRSPKTYIQEKVNGAKAAMSKLEPRDLFQIFTTALSITVNILTHFLGN